jgi:uncharacterized membrane protein
MASHAEAAEREYLWRACIRVQGAGWETVELDLARNRSLCFRALVDPFVGPARKEAALVDWYVIVLRAIHILAAVFWVGSFYTFFFFVEPSVKEMGPAGGQLMSHLAQRKKMPIVIAATAATAIVAGILLYWRASDGFDIDWITSATGLAFTVGALSAIVAFALGFIVVKPAVEQMGTIGQGIGATGVAPTEEQMTEMQRLGARLVLIGRVDLVLLTVAVITMAVARFL